jgi:hypothetical protein
LIRNELLTELMTDTMEEVKITAESKMKKHVTIVGVIHIAFGVLGLIGAMTLFC